MTEACKPAIDIEIRYDGETVRGWYQEWTWGLGNLTVCFNGISKQIPIPDTNPHDAAVAAFGNLVSKNWRPQSFIPESIPVKIRNVAFKYLNGLLHTDDQMIYASELIDAIAETSNENESNQQIAWLCINTIKAVVPAWPASCDDRTPNDRLKRLTDHMTGKTLIQDWETLRKPPLAKRGGKPIVDCVSCMVAPIAEAIANCAIFVHQHDLKAAKKVLYCCDAAQDEGAWNSADLRFADWLIKIALPPSIRREEMPDSQIYAT